MNKLTDFLQRKEQYVRVCLLLLLSWLGTYGISYIYSLVAEEYFSNGILSLAVFILLYKFMKETENKLASMEAGKARRRHIGVAFAIAFVFAVSLVMGYQLKAWDMTESGFKAKGMILLRGLCLSAAVFPFANTIVDWADKFQAGSICKKNSSRKVISEKVISLDSEKKQWKSGKAFLVCWGVLFLCWIPVFLAYYPAVMAYDFHRQSVEAMQGFVWFNSHHPLIHTWLIWVFFQLGQAVGSLQTGMACYSIFQMLVLSASLAYSAVMVYRLTKKRWALITTTLFFGLFPFISILSLGVTKDVLFAALFAVFVTLLMERTLIKPEKKRWLIDVLLVLEGILMCMFRNNALYAIAVFAVVFVVLAAKKDRLRVLAICLVLVMGSKFGMEGIQLALGSQIRGSESEKYSVLMQQFARVGYYHKNEMDPETYALLNTYVSDTYWENYYAPISDSVKGSIAGDNYVRNWDGKMTEVFRAWATIGMQYPNEYIDAFLCLTAGFWFMDDVTWAEVLGYGVEDRRGALHTFNSTVSDLIPEGIAHESKLPWLENFLEEIVSGNSFYNWPVFSNLFKPALYCWILVLCFVLFIYTKQKEKCLMTCYPLLYLLTMFLGPVVQIRYVLPIIVVIPAMLAMWKYQLKGQDKVQDK